MTASRFACEPHPALRPFVHSYWGFVREFAEPGWFDVTPDCYLEAMYFTDPPRAASAHAEGRLAQCTLIPLLDEPLRIETRGTIRCASIRMYAWAAGLVFPGADERARVWYEAGHPFAAAIATVTAALHGDAWSEIAAIFDRLLLRSFACVTEGSADPVARAFVQPTETGTSPATDDVATRNGTSRRFVERSVRAETHRSPKQLANLRRFQRVRDTLWARPDMTLAALAVEAGYADQAHLSRDFRRYAACSPGEFKRACTRVKALAGADVAIVQDVRSAREYAERL